MPNCVHLARRLRAAGQYGGFISRLCYTAACAELCSLGPAASRRWAVWRLYKPTILHGLCRTVFTWPGGFAPAGPRGGLCRLCSLRCWRVPDMVFCKKMSAAGSSSSSWFLLSAWLIKSLRQPLGSRSGVAMESFLKSTEGFSFNELVDKDDEEETQALPAQSSHKPSSSSKRKKEKKSKKARKTDTDDGTFVNVKLETSTVETKTTTKDEDVDLEEVVTEDPYAAADGGPGEDDDCEGPLPSKRAMQRAFQGFTRRPGGWKHKKAGKGPAKGKGRGKKVAPGTLM